MDLITSKEFNNLKKTVIFIKLAYKNRLPIFEYVPLLGGISQNNVVELDKSLSTAHSEPPTNIVEFQGSNPMPVTVKVCPPPKLPEEDKYKDNLNECAGNVPSVHICFS